MKYLRKHKVDILVMFSFFLISLVLVSIWYKGVDFYGGGEEGLSLWRPEKSFSTAKYAWLEVGLGYPSPFFLPRITLYALTALLNKMFAAKVIQQLFFVANIVTAFSGVYLLTKSFAKEKTLLALFSGCFYVFNLYTQSQVFARFVYTGIFAWAFIPFFLYLFAKWLEEGRVKHFIFFLSLNLLASHTYSHPSYILITWFILGLWYLMFLVRSLDKLKPTRRFFGVLFLWILTNIWWIYPMIRLSGSTTGNPSIRGWEYDFATLQGLSRDFTNLDVFLLKQKYFFERSGLWGEFYKTAVAYLLSLAGVLFMFVGLFKKKAISNKVTFVFLMFIGWFMSKGANPPFGNVFYGNTFSILPILGMFRNSYEKFGVMFLLPYSIFFAVGVTSMANFFKNKTMVIFYILVAFFITGFLVWPMWTGAVFSKKAQVSVPDYYKETNAFLDDYDSELRVLSLPFVPGEGVHYVWEGGNYYGLEPSEFLFNRSFVSWTIPNSYATDKSKEIIGHLVEDQLPDQLLKELGIGNVLLHRDMNTAYSAAESLDETELLLKNQNSLKYVKSVGKLDVYLVKGVKRGILDIETNCQDKPDIEYMKLNPRRYVINIRNSRCPFDLILKTTYHDFWEANLNENVLPNHKLAYGYANSWEVNKFGNYQIDIIFKVWPWE